MEEGFFIEKIEIDGYDDLVNIIKGKTDKCRDLRNNSYFEVLKTMFLI